MDGHVHASNYREEAANQNLLRVFPGGHTRAYCRTSLVAVGAAVGAAHLELQRSWPLDQTLAQLGVATSHVAAYRDGNCVIRSVGYPYSARYGILVNLYTHQHNQGHSDHCYSYRTLHSCYDLLDFPFLAGFRCRS